MNPNISSLKACRTFGSMDAPMLERLAAIVRVKSFCARETIFGEGDLCTGFYLVTEGAVKVYKLSPEGKEHVLHLVWPGETFAEAALFMGDAYPAYAEAIRSTRALFFPRDAFVSLIREDPEISMRLLAGMAVWLRTLVSQVEVLALRDSASRLAHYLAQRCSDGKVALEVAKSVLASHLGMTPETLSRLFYKMEANGLIRVSGRSIAVLDEEGLKAIAEGEPGF